MTLASSIITSAFRESNLVPIVETPTSAEVTEGLARLNPIILSSLGNEAGSELHDIAIGGAYDQSQFVSSWIPENTRLACSLSGGRTLYANPRPYEGCRLAVVDAANNFASNNLIINGNGRLIEGASSVTLNTNGLNRQWLYRADTGNWAKISALASSDEMPFPEEFDDYFITRLALRLNPRNNVKTSQETAAELQRIEAKLRARYRKPRRPQELGTLGIMGSAGTGSLGGDLFR